MSYEYVTRGKKVLPSLRSFECGAYRHGLESPACAWMVTNPAMA